MINDPSAAESKPDLVDVIHEWLGQSGQRKIWGLEPIPYPFDNTGTRCSNLFLRETDVPYFWITPYAVCDKGDLNRRFEPSDPEFFVKLQKEMDYREQSNTIICRCNQCEGTKR